MIITCVPLYLHLLLWGYTYCNWLVACPSMHCLNFLSATLYFSCHHHYLCLHTASCSCVFLGLSSALDCIYTASCFCASLHHYYDFIQIAVKERERLASDTVERSSTLVATTNIIIIHLHKIVIRDCGFHKTKELLESHEKSIWHY